MASNEKITDGVDVCVCGHNIRYNSIFGWYHYTTKGSGVYHTNYPHKKGYCPCRNPRPKVGRRLKTMKNEKISEYTCIRGISGNHCLCITAGQADQRVCCKCGSVFYIRLIVTGQSDKKESEPDG